MYYALTSVKYRSPPFSRIIGTCISVKVENGLVFQRIRKSEHKFSAGCPRKPVVSEK